MQSLKDVSTGTTPDPGHDELRRERQAELRAVLADKSTDEARRLALAFARVDHADYPQYDGYFEGWHLAECRQRFTTKGGVKMEPGDLLLATEDRRGRCALELSATLILASRGFSAVAQLDVAGRIARVA
jgi:hypothetical protein